MTITISTSPIATIIHNVYAPQAHAPIYKKDLFYKNLEDELEKGPTPANGGHERETPTQTTSGRMHAGRLHSQPNGRKGS
jgi:hypothetical protein